MNESEVLLTTQQASELLQVHESSIKRRCNAGTLACTYTPGGHRRIPLGALLDYARVESLPSVLTPFAGFETEVWLALDELRRDDVLDSFTDLGFKWLYHGYSRYVRDVIDLLTAEGVKHGRVFDRLITAIMYRIGHGYVDRELTIGDEHRMTQHVRDILMHLEPLRNVPSSSRQDDGVPTAIVGCARSEVHELGALMTRRILEFNGYNVQYLGLDVPTEEFARAQQKFKASLVCVSIMPPQTTRDAINVVRLLDDLYRKSSPYRLVLGGSALNDQAPGDLRTRNLAEVVSFSELNDFEHWLLNLAD